MSVAACIEALRVMVEGITPTAKPGRKFRVVPEDSPSQSRHVRILPRGLVGQGSYLGPCYSPQWQVDITSYYPTEATSDETLSLIVQDASDILRAVTRPPNTPSRPWNVIQFASHSIEEQEGGGFVSILALSLEEAA